MRPCCPAWGASSCVRSAWLRKRGVGGAPQVLIEPACQSDARPDLKHSGFEADGNATGRDDRLGYRFCRFRAGEQGEFVHAEPEHVVGRPEPFLDACFPNFPAPSRLKIVSMHRLPQVEAILAQKEGGANGSKRSSSVASRRACDKSAKPAGMPKPDGEWRLVVDLFDPVPILPRELDAIEMFLGDIIDDVLVLLTEPSKSRA